MIRVAPRWAKGIGPGLAVALALTGLGAPSALAQAPPGARHEWASCTEHIPDGATRPEMHETFPERGFSGYAANLEITVVHGKGETVLPEGLKLQKGAEAARVLADQGFQLPDPEGGSPPSLTSEVSGEKATTKLVLPFLTLPKEPGRHAMLLPPVPVAVSRASGELFTLCTSPHTILVEDPIANDPDPKVKPNPPGRSQREEWVLAKQLAIGVLVGALLALVAAWLYRRWMKRPKPVPIVPPKLPWIEALEEIEAIRRSSLLEDAQNDVYFDRVSDCVRKYLGARYGFDGLESTTDEMRATLKRVRPTVPVLPEIAKFLAEADLVKFARVLPSEEDCLGALEGGEQIVRRTIPPPATLKEARDRDAPPPGPKQPPRRPGRRKKQEEAA